MELLIVSLRCPEASLAQLHVRYLSASSFVQVLGLQAAGHPVGCGALVHATKKWRDLRGFQLPCRSGPIEWHKPLLSRLSHCLLVRVFLDVNLSPGRMRLSEGGTESQPDRLLKPIRGENLCRWPSTVQQRNVLAVMQIQFEPESRYSIVQIMGCGLQFKGSTVQRNYLVQVYMLTCLAESYKQAFGEDVK